MIRAVLYARYSSDLQSPSSITDQHRALRDALPRLGLREIGAHSDAAISGSSLARPGLEAALAEIEAGRAGVLVAEALDRISRDLEHVARIAKRIAFRGARIVTLSEGEIGALHIGLAGTMSQLYLEQLAEKTRRGLRGVVADGRIAAAPAFGYRTTGVAGRFAIDKGEAEVVCRIFADYVSGRSPRAIARALNADSIAGPRGGPWKSNTILGSRAQGTGITNNRLYAGEIVWNRQTWRKDPATGRRRSFLNASDEWVIVPAPEMRIVPDSLWLAARQRQGDIVQRPGVRRPTRPLSGLLVCSECGSRMTLFSRTRYGCPRHKETGLCGNNRTALVDEVERRVLDGLRANFCRPEAIEEYSRAYTEQSARLRSESAGHEVALRRELAEAERDQAAALDMMTRVPPDALDALAARIGAAATRIKAAKAKLADLPAATVVPLGRVSAEHMSRNLARLWAQLAEDEIAAAEARSALGALITKIRLIPGEARGAFTLEIEGDLSAFLGLGDSTYPLVAGAGFEPATFRL